MENNTQQLKEKIVYEKEGVSVWDWLLTMFILCVPIVNLVFCIVWACSLNTHPSKADYCKAVLAWGAIIICLIIVLMIVGSSIVSSLFGPFAGNIRL